jgi:mRNA interferase MazF
LNHGDIHWVNLPDRGGREQRGRRPAVICQDTAAFPRLPTVLTIPLTSKLDTQRFAGTYPPQPSPENGLTVPSIALVFQLGATDVTRVEDRLGMVGATDMAGLRELAAKIQKLA